MLEGKGAVQPQAERKLPNIVVENDGIFLTGKPLYNPDVISNRNPFIESIAPRLVDEANKFVQEHSDQAGSVRDYFMKVGLNPGLVNININK